MNGMFLAGSIQAFFFALLIFNKSKKSKADCLLGFWLILLGIHMLFPFFLYLDYPRFVFLSGWDVGFLVLHAAFLYIYTGFLTGSYKGFTLFHLLHLIPFGLTYFLTIPYIVMTAKEKAALMENKSPVPIFLLISSLFVLGAIIFYMFFLLKGIRSYQDKIKNIQSNIDKINLSWLKQLSRGWMGVYSLLVLGGSTMIYFHILYIQIDYIIYLLIVVLIFFIGFWGVRQGQVFSYSSKGRWSLAEQGKKEVVIQPEDKKFARNLIEFMEDKKPFLNNELSLYSLADQLSAKPYYISFILNNILKTNFYDLINAYRVKECKKKLRTFSLKKDTFLSVALDCGFNSKPSFNRIFKRETGKTPTQYKKSLQ